MGQKPSILLGSTNFLHFTNNKHDHIAWIRRRHRPSNANNNPEQPIKFQYSCKTKRKNFDNSTQLNNYVSNRSETSDSGRKEKNVNNEQVTCRIIKTIPNRTKSEPNLTNHNNNREKHGRHRRKNNNRNNKEEWGGKMQQFGYEIQDVDNFLTKATIEEPANIPVVLAFPTVLYQTRIGGYQAEIALPLGMVVNAIFKNENWLYVQTPHAEEGYVSYAACLPLGIIPPPDDDDSPAWEKSTDIFPKPCGNMTDTEKLSSKSDCETVASSTRGRRPRSAFSTNCGEKHVDRLYLRATSKRHNNHRTNTIVRQTLLVVNSDFQSANSNTLTVSQGDVVILLNNQQNHWFWVRNKQGEEGFIPASVAGHGFL